MRADLSSSGSLSFLVRRSLDIESHEEPDESGLRDQQQGVCPAVTVVAPQALDVDIAVSRSIAGGGDALADFTNCDIDRILPRLCPTDDPRHRKRHAVPLLSGGGAMTPILTRRSLMGFVLDCGGTIGSGRVRLRLSFGHEDSDASNAK